MAGREEKGESKQLVRGGLKEVVVILAKFVFALLFLPPVIASTRALQAEVLHFDATLQHDLWVGLVWYLVFFFFIYDFAVVYRFGQNVMTFCFQFLKPLVNFAPYVIPVYTIIVLIVFAVLNAAGVRGEWKDALYSLMAATFTMHVVLTAKDLYQKDSAPGKPTYLFGMSVVYIVDVFFIALIMNMTLPGFSFVRFFQGLAEITFGIYKGVLTQLFL